MHSRKCLIATAEVDAGIGAKAVIEAFVPVVKQHHDTQEDMPNRRHDDVTSQIKGCTPMKGNHQSDVGTA